MSLAKPRIHFVDDEPELLRAIARGVKRRRPKWALQFDTDPNEALTAFETAPADIVVSDLRMPGLTGLDMLQEMRRRRPDAPSGFVMLTGTGDFQSAIAAMNEAHVVKFLEKPCPTETLISAVDEVLASNASQLPAIAAHAEEAANAVNAAVLILDADARLLYANAAGRELLAEADPFTLSEDRICRPRHAASREAFSSLVSSCADDDEVRPKWLTVQRSLTDGYVSLFAKPDVSTPGERRVTIVASDPERRTVLCADAVRELFSLSRAEAAIAISIAKGDRLEDAAAASGVTVSSARTYLKRVFLKTGTGRQADLVKLVHNSPAALTKRAS